MKRRTTFGFLAVVALLTASIGHAQVPAQLPAQLPAKSPAPANLLNVSYDPTRELYQALNKAFAAQHQSRTGQVVTIRQSHGGSARIDRLG